jgi:FixJ family two-component response regulator
VEHPPIVCIVEDDTSLRDALARLVRAYGFEAEAFASAEEVLPRLEAGSLHCTVLVLDIHLGAMSGFDLHDRLTKMGVSIPTIFMTGCDDPSHRERVSQIGAAVYLVKPFEDLGFIDAISVALQKR